MKTNKTEREKILNLLQQNQAIFKQFGVAKFAIFGSTVREEATEHSDVDILVSFEKTSTWSYSLVLSMHTLLLSKHILSLYIRVVV